MPELSAPGSTGGTALAAWSLSLTQGLPPRRLAVGGAMCEQEAAPDGSVGTPNRHCNGFSRRGECHVSQTRVAGGETSGVQSLQQPLSLGELDTSDLNPRSATVSIGDRCFPAVCVHNLSDDPQPKSRPLLGDRVARLKDVGTLFF